MYIFYFASHECILLNESCMVMVWWDLPVKIPLYQTKSLRHTLEHLNEAGWRGSQAADFLCPSWSLSMPRFLLPPILMLRQRITKWNMNTLTRTWVESMVKVKMRNLPTNFKKLLVCSKVEKHFKHCACKEDRKCLHKLIKIWHKLQHVVAALWLVQGASISILFSALLSGYLYPDSKH